MTDQAGRKRKPKKLNLEQSGPAWHRWRSQGLGGSDAPSLMGGSPWTSPDELVEQKLGLRTVAENDRMRRGKRLEPDARAHYIAATGNEVAPCCVEHEDHPWLKASLDGMSPDGKIVLEIKCPSVGSHWQALRGRYPSYYKDQLFHQLLVTGAGELHYYSYCPDEPDTFPEGRHGALVVVYPDEEYQARLFEAEKRFWERVQRLQKGKKGAK